MVYLILTLNHIYPDYDFSQLRPHHFEKEAKVSDVQETVDSHLLEVAKVSFFWAFQSISLEIRGSCKAPIFPGSNFFP